MKKLDLKKISSEMYRGIDSINSITKEDYHLLLVLLNPTAPHITEELWQNLGHEITIANESWPKYC